MLSTLLPAHIVQHITANHSATSSSPSSIISDSSKKSGSSPSGRKQSTQPTSYSSSSVGLSKILVNGAPARDSVGSVEEFLPDGMGVREALARCEDPTLGWSLQFWITIADPVTQHVFFACPATGQASWVPPQGVFIVPRQPEGEWWELADKTRNNRSYFYNTLTRDTQWTRPGENQFVIPLGLIQSSASPERHEKRSRYVSASSAVHLKPNDPSSPLVRGRHQSDPPNSSTGTFGPLPPPMPRREIFGATESGSTPLRIAARNPDSGRDSVSTPNSMTSQTGADQLSPLSPTPRTPASPLSRNRNAHTLSIVGEGEEDTGPGSNESESGNEADQSIISGRTGHTVHSERTVRTLRAGETKFEEKRETGIRFLGSWGKQGRKTSSSGSMSDRKGGNLPTMLPAPWLKRNGSSISVGISSPIGWPMNHHENHSVPILPLGKSHAPIPVRSTVRTKRLSTGIHPILPSSISAEIQHTQGVDFASTYFATRRSGLLWQKIPIDKVLEWQKQPISAPLLNSSKGSAAKEAVTCFKVVQRTMGERDRPVEGVKVPMRSSASLPDMAGMVADYAAVGGVRLADRKEKVNGGGRGHKMVVLEEIQWMVQTCVARAELKDEVYCQVIKQVTRNPNPEAVELGFQLASVLATAFPPGPNFQPFVRQFLQSYLDCETETIAKMARYALTKLTTTATRNGRGRALTIGEIEHASDAAFYPSVYGESLTKIMRDQSTSHPQDKVPVILPFLARAILQSGGLKAEGIFRIPGDGDIVSEIKSRMDRGHYQFAGIVDPHIAASLFKLWLRELEEPLIPSDLYNKALASSSSSDPTRAIAFVRHLPMYNRRVLLFVIAFFQLFCKEEVMAVTKMTPHNLALVLAPNILRTTSDSIVVVFNNSGFESRFVLLLLQYLNVEELDKEYTPIIDTM